MSATTPQNSFSLRRTDGEWSLIVNGFDLTHVVARDGAQVRLKNGYPYLSVELLATADAEVVCEQAHIEVTQRGVTK